MIGRRTLSAFLAFVTAVALSAVALVSGAGSAGALTCTSSGSPTVTTDKPDYIIGETVHISGTGYACGATVTVKVVAPDGTVSTQHVGIADDGTLTATYPIPRVNPVGRYHLSVLDAAGHVLASTLFSDTHFRYATLSWSRPSLSSRVVTFTLQVAFRLGYFTSCLGHQPVVGEVIAPPTCSAGQIAFGDGNFLAFGFTVTSVDATNDILQGFTQFTHTYAGTGTSFTADWNNCCRLSSLRNNHDTNWNEQTVVNLDPTTGALQNPTSSMAALNDCAIGALCTLPVPAADSDPNTTSFTYRLATPAEMGDNTETQPPGLTIGANTGVVSWMTPGTGHNGDLWNTVIIVEARNAANQIITSTEVDFLIRLVTGVPPTFVTPPTPTDGSVLNATVGNQITVPLRATSSVGRNVTINNVTGISGASFSCPPATPTIDCTFTWTPTLNDTGSHLVSFQAEDATGALSATRTFTIDVPKVVVTVTPDNQSKTYGDPDPTFSFHYSGFQGTDDFTTQPTCGVSGPHANAGTYSITCSGGVAPTGYTIQYNTATLTVGQATVTITANNQTITYGDPEPTFTYTVSGLQGSDTLTTQPTCNVAGPHANVGTYAITCSGADAGPNYTIGYVGGTLTVNQATVTITADNQSKTYGDPDPTFTYSVSGLQGSDALTTQPTCNVAGPHANVGTYTITCSGADAGPNYAISYVDGTLTVNQATVTISADNQTITYGDPDPTFTYTVSGLQGSDTLTAQPTCGVNGAHHNAGTYEISCSGAAASGNYTIAYVDGTLTVNQATVTISADNQSKTYGDPDPTFTYTVSGLQGSDALTTQPTCGVAGVHANAGTYTITCSGADAGPNYAISYVDGTLTVHQATVTITADNASKLPGQPDPAFTFTTSGLVGGDTLTTQPTCGVSGAHNTPGTYSITCSGANAGPNYTIQYVAGTLTVAKASPAMNTSPSNTVPVGGSISDTATLVNGANPTGSVTFTLYAPGDIHCARAILTRSGGLNGSGMAQSGGFQATQAGTYQWIASYPGDVDNNDVSGTCGQEPVVVTPQVLTGRAYGLAASATLGTKTLLNVKPTPDTGAVVTTGSGTVGPKCVLSIPGIVGVKAVCASVTTNNSFPAKSSGTASIAAATVGVTGVPAIVVQAVQATSSTTCGGSAGATTIAYLRVGTVVVINKPTLIKPNTTINVGIVKLVLNEQHPFSTPDKGLTVNAVHATVNVLGHPLLNVVLASAESDIGNCP